MNNEFLRTFWKLNGAKLLRSEVSYAFLGPHSHSYQPIQGPHSAGGNRRWGHDWWLHDRTYCCCISHLNLAIFVSFSLGTLRGSTRLTENWDMHSEKEQCWINDSGITQKNILARWGDGVQFICSDLNRVGIKKAFSILPAWVFPASWPLTLPEKHRSVSTKTKYRSLKARDLVLNIAKICNRKEFLSDL